MQRRVALEEHCGHIDPAKTAASSDSVMPLCFTYSAGAWCSVMPSEKTSDIVVVTLGRNALGRHVRDRSADLGHGAAVVHPDHTVN